MSRTTVCVSLLLLTSAGSLSGQSLRGVVLAEDSSRVSGAIVTLEPPDAEPRLSVLTDALGQFQLTSPTPGEFRLRIHRLGFREHLSEVIRLDRGSDVMVRVTLSVDAVEIEGIDVQVFEEVDQRLGRRGFYERRDLYSSKMGFATFLDRSDIDRANAFYVTDLLRMAPGLRVVSAGARGYQVTTRKPWCTPAVFVDGHPAVGPINEIISPSDLVGVEIYPSSIAPLQYAADCGSILLWTGVPEPRGR